MSISNQWEQTVSALRQQRDELKVQMALAKAEVKEEWHELEQQWGELEARAQAVGKDASAAAAEVEAAARKLADQIESGYKRVRDRLKQ